MSRVVDLINNSAAAVTTFTVMTGYLAYAKNRFWFPFFSRVPEPIKAEVRRLLLAAHSISPSTRVEITFSRISGESVWLLVRYVQSQTNLTGKAIPFESRFTTNRRKYKIVSIKIDEHDAAPNTMVESEFAVNGTIPPKQTMSMDVQFEMLYSQTDSDLFVSYLPLSKYSFSVVDAVSENAGQQALFFEVERLISPERLNGSPTTNVGGHQYSMQFAVDGGLPPYAGVYLKWRKAS